MATPHGNYTVDAVGAAGPGWATDVAAALNKIDAAIPINPKNFGCAVDATTDDSTPWQILMTACGNLTTPTTIDLNGGILRTTKNLYSFGPVSIINGAVLLDGDLAASDGRAYWWLLGVGSKGAAAVPWTGFLRNFKAVATAAARTARMLNFIAAGTATAAYGARDLTVDVTATAGNDAVGFGGICALTDTAWATSPPAVARKHGRFRDIICLANQDATLGSEGFDHSNCDDFQLDGYYCEGFGDDGFALDGFDGVITNPKVRNVTIKGADGRFIAETTSGGQFSNIHVERVPDRLGAVNGAGQLFSIQMWPWVAPITSGEPGRRCEISNITCVVPSSWTGATIMFDIKGLRDAAINNVVLANDSPNTSSGMSIQAATNSNWTDSTGSGVGGETDHTARVRNVDIANVISTGSVPVQIAMPGATSDYVNVGFTGCITGDATRKNQINGTRVRYGLSNHPVDGTGTALDLVPGTCVPDALVLWEGTVNVTANNSGNASLGAGISGYAVDRFIPRRTGIILAIEVTYEANQTAGSVTFGIKKNGSGIVDSFNLTSGAGGRLDYNANGSNKFVAGDIFNASYIANSGFLPTPTAAQIRLIGRYTD